MSFTIAETKIETPCYFRIEKGSTGMYFKCVSLYINGDHQYFCSIISKDTAEQLAAKYNLEILEP